uniref:Class IIb bacteriocin, lactobin A/cerein 7B family n=1 Tax=Sphingobacterium sp. (strain 21) TaxID=743722 RepID=F4C8X8_SPHS2
MKKLSLDEMEEIHGGSCAGAYTILGIGIVGMALGGAGGLLELGAAAYIMAYC